MVKVEIKSSGSLFHYAHFLGDCLFPEINAKLYEKGIVYRTRNLKQSIGNFSKIYEEVMSVKNVELPPKEFEKLDDKKIKLARSKKPRKSEFLFFRDYIFKKLNINLDNSYPEIILIQRGERIELLSDPELIKNNNNHTTGSERREIERIEELKSFMQETFKNKFKTLVLETLSFREQVQHFYNANFIIAVHGAAITNVLFSNPRCKLLEVLGDRTYSFFDVITHTLEINHTKCENNLEIIKNKILLLRGMRKPNREEIMDILIDRVISEKHEVSKNKTFFPVPTIFYIGMEKTGSKSLLFGFPNHKVAHWHSLNYFEEKYETNLFSKNNIDLYDFGLYIGKKYKFKPLFIESIREPISQIISAIMQHFKKYNSSNCNCELCKNIGMTNEFLDIVKKNVNINNWINFKTRGFQSISMWKKHFNIDLINVFIKDNCFYDFSNCKILLLRLEDSEKREKLFKKIGYTYVETFSNRTEDNDKVSDLYRYIKDNLRFSEDELNKIYSNEVKVFYKSNEIESFKDKWRKKMIIL